MKDKYCLTIIDMQKDFTSSLGYYANKPHDMGPIYAIEKKIKEALPILYRNFPIVYIVSEFRDKQFGENKTICIKGSDGCDLSINDNYASVVITKNDLSAFSTQEYMEYLKSNQINCIITMGVITEYCVKETVLDSLKNGFKTIVVEDCIATGGDEEENRVNTIRELKEKGAIFKNLDELLIDLDLIK